MHDIKIIRKNPDLFLKKIKDRNENISLDNLLNSDKKNRELIQKKEKLEQQKKNISQKKDKTQFKLSKEISLEIDKLNKEQGELKKEIELILSSLPNLALDDVPVGKDEKANKEISKFGEIKKFEFKPLSHDQIGIKLEQMDFNIASKTSGARFVFLKNNLALFL